MRNKSVLRLSFLVLILWLLLGCSIHTGSHATIVWEQNPVPQNTEGTYTVVQLRAREIAAETQKQIEESLGETAVITKRNNSIEGKRAKDGIVFRESYLEGPDDPVAAFFENDPSVSREDAVKTADSFLQGIGYPDEYQVLSAERAVVTDEQSCFSKGWDCTYTRCCDGLQTVCTTTEPAPLYSADAFPASRFAPWNQLEYIWIYIDETGVYRVRFSAPCEKTGLEEQVELISFETIQEHAEQLIPKVYGWNLSDAYTIVFHQATLRRALLRLSDENEVAYSVPCWEIHYTASLEEFSDERFLYLDARDGSFVDPYTEATAK